MEKYEHKPSNEIPLVMSVPEMARLLRIGRNAGYSLVRSGKIRAIRIGKSIRISRSALLEYLNE